MLAGCAESFTSLMLIAADGQITRPRPGPSAPPPPQDCRLACSERQVRVCVGLVGVS